jgi:integrase
MVLNKDLPSLKPDFPLFYRGNPKTDKGIPSKFVNQQMGERFLKAVPRDIADFLGKENLADFKSHTFRHTAATLAAENLVPTAQMMVSSTFEIAISDLNTFEISN